MGRVPKRDGRKCRAIFGYLGSNMYNKKRCRDDAGDRMIEGWEQLVKTAASTVLGNKSMVCNRAVRWWDEEVEELLE